MNIVCSTSCSRNKTITNNGLTCCAWCEHLDNCLKIGYHGLCSSIKNKIYDMNTCIQCDAASIER